MIWLHHRLYYSAILILVWIPDISWGREEIRVNVDNNASGVPNCNKCTVEFLKFSKLEQIVWKKYINLDFAVGGPLVQNFQTMHFALTQVEIYKADHNHEAIESLQSEEKNLLKFYFKDLKLSTEEMHEKLRNLYEKISLTRAWQKYQETVMDNQEYAKLANHLPEPSKAEIRNLEAVTNSTGSNKTDTHEEL